MHVHCVIPAGGLSPDGQREKAFATFLRELFRQDWVVYAKPPFGGLEHLRPKGFVRIHFPPQSLFGACPSSISSVPPAVNSAWVIQKRPSRGFPFSLADWM